MSILPPLLFGISASLDALLVSMALGLQKVPLPARHNLLISTVTLIGTVISIGLGNLLLPLFPIGIGTRIGSSVLILSVFTTWENGCFPDGAAIFPRIIICARKRKNLSGTGNYPCRRYWRWAVPFP